FVFLVRVIQSIYFFFFFSSRRRHTRLQGDWSSDVCSSDLTPVPLSNQPPQPLPPPTGQPPYHLSLDNVLPAASMQAIRASGKLRSEERRVGKSVDLGGGGSIKKKNE